MYVPQAFSQTDPDKLACLIRENGFGELVTAIDGTPVVSHLPFMFEPDEGALGILHAHVARANPHWKQGDCKAMAVFVGPHHYISPTWYEEAGTVPTWAYVAVHVRGTLEWSDDPGAARAVLERLVAFHERGRPHPWAADFESPDLERKMRGIVSLRIVVEAIEGQWKLNQNHPPERRARTARALRELPAQDAQAIAALMEENLLRRSSND